MQYLIPAAGMGQRFRNAGFNISKPFIELHGVPLILWVISNFTFDDADSLHIVLQRDLSNKKYLNNLINILEVKPQFIFLDGLTDGAARTVAYATQELDPNDSLIVANSDQYITRDLSEYFVQCKTMENEGHVLTMEADSDKWSYVSKLGQDRIESIVEKKVISNEATVGIYAWRQINDFQKSFAAMVENNDRVNGEFYLAPTYNYLIKQGAKISSYNIGKVGLHVHGLGTPEDLKDFSNKKISLIHAKRIIKRFKLKN